MKFLNRYAIRLFSGLLLLMLFVACRKDGNPNKLDNVPESEYTGNTGSDVIKILAIGNSFSEDAIETHLYDLAKVAGKKVIIANLFIPGAPLALHASNAESNASAYEYRKIDSSGVKINFPKVSIATAVAEENWDYISFQQVSQNSGQFSTFQDSLPILYNYVKGRNKNPDTKYVLHQTWAYAQSSTHTGFANYGNDQMMMYNAIVDAYNRAKTLINADLLIPSGTAVQNARTSVVGDNFTRDGYHLTIPMGRYLAACTWFEALFGTSVVGNSYKPAELSDFEASICQNAAHLAILNPDAVTEMVDFQGDGNFTGSILLNFGTAAAPAGWNGLTGFTVGASVALKNNTNNYTGVGATVTERFNGANTSGEGTTTTILEMPNSVAASAFFGNSRAVFSNMLIPQSKIEISGLNPSQRYNFCYFGSRNSSSDNRETRFITTGANEVIVDQNTSNNKTIVSCADMVQPNADGKIVITVTSGPNNNNGSGFFYINAMRITTAQ